MDLTRTAMAILEYDKAKTYEEIEQALLNVKEAFALDSASVNSRDCAMLVSPNGGNGWLRKMAVKAGFTECGLTPEVRRSRGWGW